MPKLTILKKISLPFSATNGQTSTVGEPSLAINKNQILYSGNWYACKSIDNGETWKYLNPYTFLSPPSTDFCCDQSIIYDPSRNLTFWVLQYNQDSNGENTFRIAVKKGATLNDNQWYWWDFQSQINNDWKNHWFDYNHVALSNNFLYVGTNLFKGDDWVKCIIFKISLDELADENSNLNFAFYESISNGSLRCTLGAKDVMYFASINSNKSIKVFEWPENTDQVTEKVVNVSSFNATRNYSAPSPDGYNWLSRCDERITGAWVTNDILGFMWTVDLKGSKPYPYVRVVRINLKDMVLIDEPDIWSPNYAYAYPDACPNKNGEVGITLYRGGGSKYPSHVIGYLETNGTWKLLVTKESTNGPADETWGDYVTCRSYTEDSQSWIAAGLTLQGGSSYKHVEPLFIQFGLKSSVKI